MTLTTAELKRIYAALLNSMGVLAITEDIDEFSNVEDLANKVKHEIESRRYDDDEE